MSEDPSKLDISDEMIAERRGGSGKMPTDMPSWMATSIINIDKFSKWIGNIVCWILMPLIFAMTYEVLARKLFLAPTIWAYDISRFLYGALFMLGAGFTYLANEHVRIDVFYREASKKYKATVDLFGNIFLLLPFLYIIWNYSYPFVYRSFLMGEVSREAGGMLALYILKSAILWFCLVLFLHLVSNLINSILTLSN